MKIHGNSHIQNLELVLCLLPLCAEADILSPGGQLGASVFQGGHRACQDQSYTGVACPAGSGVTARALQTPAARRGGLQ